LPHAAVNERFAWLSAIDPERFRADVNRAIDQTL
jgi:hypothetical protein